MEIKSIWTIIDRANLHYLKAGCGPGLLLVHGLLGGSFCWRRNIHCLAERHTAIAVDLPGFGESDAPRDQDTGMQVQAIRLLRLIEELGLEAVDVVASSWGGAVALLLASYSGKVRSLVLAAPVNPWSQYGARRVRFLAGRVGSGLLRAGIPVSRPIHARVLERLYGDTRRIPEGTVAGYSAILMRPGRVHSILSTLRNWENDVNALREAIPRVTSRCLLVWGTQDGAVDLASSDALMQELPACECAVLPGVGHLPFEEVPEEFNRLVLEFVDRA